MSKLVHFAMLTALVTVTSVVSSPANAADSKSVSPSMCRPLAAPDAQGLVFDTRGVINSSTTNKRILCSMPRDAENAYSPSSSASLTHHFSAGAIDGSVSCTYYLGPVGFPGMVFETYTASASAAAGQKNYKAANITTYPSSWYSGGTTAVCTLSPKTTLAVFFMTESGPTSN